LGAAAASAVAFILGGVLLTVSLLRHKVISPKGQSFKPDLELLIPCFKISVPNFFQRFGTSLGYVVFAAMVNSVGSAAMAAHTVANTVESLFYIPGYGMQTAAATLAGNAYGAGDNKKMKSLCKMLIPIEIGLMVISGAALFLAARPLVSLFSSSEEVINLGSAVLKMVALSEPFFGFTIVVEGMMQGIGNTKPPFIYNILTMWGIRIVGTFICTQLLGLGLVSAWGCMVAHNLTLCALFLISFISGRWNPMNKKDK
jgi:putative MATE family efflux protein